MTTQSRTTFTAIGFVVVAAVAGACGYLYSQSQSTATTTATAATTPAGAAATHMVTTLAKANWSASAFHSFESQNLQAWLAKPANVKTLQAGLKNVGTLKGGLTIAETRTASKGKASTAFVVLTGDFTKGKQFINVAMTKQGADWKINNLSVVSQDRVFAERTYVIGAEILNKLSRTDWATGTLDQFATANLKKAEHQPKVSAALGDLAKLGTVKRVNQMLKFHYDAKTHTADLLMDVQFTHTRRPVVMVMKLADGHWALDGISVMKYTKAHPNSTAKTTTHHKTAKTEA